jgi:hypothetical protein
MWNENVISVPEVELVLAPGHRVNNNNNNNNNNNSNSNSNHKSASKPIAN